jgi:LTXXQ motif family protein
MSKSLVLGCVIALGLGALSQAAPPADGAPTDAQRAAWHHERCADRYARRVGEVAYLETRLALTDSQHPAFEAWKSIVLSNAKSGADACTDHPRDMNGPPSVVDREQHEERMLKARVEFLDAELPALTALYQTLTPEQKLVLDRGRGPHGRHGHEGDRPGRHGPGGDGPGADG